MKTPYYFARHVRVCATEELLVLLDLRQDRYCAVPAHLFAPPHGAGASIELDLHANASAVLTALVRRGLLVEAPDPTRGRVLRWRLFAACWQAGRVLSSRRLDRLVVQLRRAKAEPPLHHDVAALVQFYEAWRPWWPRDRVCLFDSVSLCLFLAWSGVHADLVIGVVGQPFAAHAWVEFERRVVNDDEEHCRRYQEIARA